MEKAGFLARFFAHVGSLLLRLGTQRIFVGAP